MRVIALFFVGMLFCNCIPHLTAGLQGARFPTPFARPRGAGQSSALLNFVWGGANLLTGLTILARRPTQIGVNLDCMSLVLGALALGTYLSLHFGKTRAGRQASA
jgi:hypothetical protein